MQTPPGAVRRARRRLIFAMRRSRRHLLRAVRGEAPMMVELGGDSRTLLIALGSLSKGVEPPVFEWVKLTRALACKRVLIRDLHQAWYQMGVPGHGDSLSAMVDSLQALIAGHDVDRMVVIGSSSGGYAALVLGTLLGADTVIAFGPQTTLDPDHLAEMRDLRWDEPLGELREQGLIDARWIDLQTALAPARWADTRYELYFDESLRSDRRHAERLAGLEGVRLHRVEGAEHFVARAMRERGTLANVLAEALAPPTRPATGETALASAPGIDEAERA